MPIASARLLAGTALCLSLFCLSSLSSLQAAASGADIIFPQVARGTLGNYVESAIVILNPQPDPVTIDLDSFGVDLPETTIVVKAGETKEIRFSGSEFQAGWVRLRSDQSVSATANILTREDATSENLLSQLTVLGQPLFRNSSCRFSSTTRTLMTRESPLPSPLPAGFASRCSTSRERPSPYETFRFQLADPTRWRT